MEGVTYDGMAMAVVVVVGSGWKWLVVVDYQ